MPAYPSESWWPGFFKEIEALYQARPQLMDLEAIGYLTRAAYDIGTGINPELAKAKQLAQLRTALGMLQRGNGRGWGRM